MIEIAYLVLMIIGKELTLRSMLKTFSWREEDYAQHWDVYRLLSLYYLLVIKTVSQNLAFFWSINLDI